ncbi:proteoglycan 4 [Aplysia californica]|uniref:Proteoglycan 4 n=1 Tax=Aplysia californica TaxID=6500 RepID=A0ABM0JEP2_APLCA|nr:proteoglycan 4 [Aplysia californica]
MASSVSATVPAVSQATKRAHAESELSAPEPAAAQQEAPPTQSPASTTAASATESPAKATVPSEPVKVDSEVPKAAVAAVAPNGEESGDNVSESNKAKDVKPTPAPPSSDSSGVPPPEPSSSATAAAAISPSEVEGKKDPPAPALPSPSKETTLKAPAADPSALEISGSGTSSGTAVVPPNNPTVNNDKAAEGSSHQAPPKQNTAASSSEKTSDATTDSVSNGTSSGKPTAMDTTEGPTQQKESVKPSSIKKDADPKLLTTTTSNNEPKANSSKVSREDGEEPEKKPRLALTVSSSKSASKTPEQVLEYMYKTFEHRRKIITKQMPTIPELKNLYPDLFMGKQLLIEFQRITKIDIDQKIQEFCVRYATAVIEMARGKPGSAPVLARWDQAKQENETLKQYWDMVTALCLLPLHFGENFVEMVVEIGEEDEVVATGTIVPTLIARGNIFRTDEFFLIAENTIVQEFEEFTIAFASLYSSYWVFNMVYPTEIENTYNYIQRCIVRQREPGTIPAVCKNFTKTLQRWNKGKENK